MTNRNKQFSIKRVEVDPELAIFGYNKESIQMGIVSVKDTNSMLFSFDNIVQISFLPYS